MTVTPSKPTSSHAAAHAASASAIPRAYRLVGWTRATVLVMMVLSSAWTGFLAVLNYAPSEVANYMMNTTQFDDGEFWQLAEIDEMIMGGSVVGLGVVACVYLYLVVLILKPRGSKPAKKGPAVRRETLTDKVRTQVMKPLGPKARTVLQEMGELRRKLVNQHGRYQKVWNLTIEIPEIIFQTVTLHSLLSNGIATQIVSAYVGAMVVNCVYCFYHITIAWRQHAFHEMVGDTLLDVVFAIVFPAVTLLHTVRDFRGGLHWMLIRELYFPAEPYERRSRMYGDPRQINTFTLAYDCLRITDRTDLIVTVGFNLLTCLRWRRIVITLQKFLKIGGPKASPDSLKQGLTVEKEPLHAGAVMIPHRVVPAYVGFLFLAFGALTVLYTSMAVSVSLAACTAVPHCSLHAYQWFPGAPDMSCPCLVFIRGQLTANAIAASDLEDATPELSLAADAGTLRTIQLMNVAIQGKLPANVKACSELRELDVHLPIVTLVETLGAHMTLSTSIGRVLLNTDFEVLPSGWTGTFQKLQTLHITTGSNCDGLLTIPPPFFAMMSSLRTLSLQGQRFLTDLSSFQGLDRLQTLYISNTIELPMVPSLVDTPRLRTLALINNRWLNSLPDLGPVQNSLQRVFVETCPLCCSGFLSLGVCNTTETDCIPFTLDFMEHLCYPTDADTETETDLSLVVGSGRFPLVSDASRAILQPFLDSRAVCDPHVRRAVRPMRGVPDSCEGVWYRQCPDGICYATSAADTPMCVNNTNAIAMRTALIVVGDRCDPVEEAWLGCP